MRRPGRRERLKCRLQSSRPTSVSDNEDTVLNSATKKRVRGGRAKRYRKALRSGRDVDIHSKAQDSDDRRMRFESRSDRSRPAVAVTR